MQLGDRNAAEFARGRLPNVHGWDAGFTSETLSLALDALTLDNLAAMAMVAVGDDIGTGAGEHNECDEGNNEVALGLPVCP